MDSDDVRGNPTGEHTAEIQRTHLGPNEYRIKDLH
jgi:hypothetical protein